MIDIMYDYDYIKSEKDYSDFKRYNLDFDIEKELSVYQNPDKLHIVKDINGIQESYSDSEFINLIDKAYERFFDDHVRYEVSLLEKKLLKLKRLPNPIQVTYKYNKKTNIIKNLENDFSDLFTKIEAHRKQFLKSVIDKVYVDAHNLDIEINVPRHTICKYIACKFTYLNYKNAKIYKSMKQYGLFINQFRFDNEDIIFNKSITYILSLLNKSDEYVRHQYVNTIDALSVNVISKYQDNSKWIKEFLDDIISSRIV